MIGALGAAAGGGMSASGGDATSGNGDQSFGSTTNFGGLNYGGTGVSPLMIVGIAAIAAVAFVMVNRS